MGVRYQAIWKSMDNIQYKIDIEDSLFSGTITEFNIGMDNMDGFSLNYEGDQSNLTNLILPSSVSINCVVQNSAFETLISDIVNAQEGRFFLRIYKYNSLGKYYEQIWAGIILADLFQLEDVSFPYNCQIQAIDGLARLENITYTNVSPYPRTFIETLCEILSALDISQFWATSTSYLSTSVNWYSHSMFSGGAPASTLDPLKVSGVLPLAFYERDSNDILTGLNLFEILNQICLRWNARLFLANGRFYFIQINEFTKTTIVLRTYDKVGTYLSDSNLSLGVSNFYRNGQYSFFRPLEKVSIIYKYKQPSTQINRLPTQALYETAVGMGLFSGGSKETAIFTGDITLSMSNSGSEVENHKWYFQMKLQVGIYYLENPGGVLGWSTNSAARVNIYSQTFYDYNYLGTIINNIETPEIPTIGDAYFELDFMYFVDDYFTQIYPPATISYSYQCSFEIKQTGSTGEAKYTALNAISGSFTEKILPPTIIADGANVQSDGRLYVYDTSPAWINSLFNWSVGGIGTPVWINDLLTGQVLNLQAAARRLYEGNIGGVTFWPFNVITVNGNKFAFLSGSLNANTNEWSGSWHEIKDT